MKKKTWIFVQMAVAALIIGIEAVLTVPVVGATYRPFSWMNLGDSGGQGAYPVLQSLSFDGKYVSVCATNVTPNKQYTLQRNLDVMNSNGWTDVASTTALKSAVMLIDTSPVHQRSYY